MNVTLPIDTADETLECACLSWIIDDDVDNILRRGTDIMERRGLNVRERFQTKRLKLYKTA